MTIGLCVKNEEGDIHFSIESIIEQDYPHNKMEIIVVDGGSKDKTLNIIKKILSKCDIEFKIFTENVGLGYARQLVVNNAKGKYIIWVDADLKLSKNYIKKQIEFMEKNPKIGITTGMYGVCSGSMVATLENLAFVVDTYKWRGKEHPRLPPTEGSVFRVRAIREVGGFDIKIKGACEDIDATYRIKKKGWLSYVTPAVFYEKCVETWKDLWNQYVWWGYGGHYLSHKDKRINPIYEMTPLAGFYAGLMRVRISYKLTLRKTSFLLPIHGAFKRTAWLYGFIKSHIEGYGHRTL